MLDSVFFKRISKNDSGKSLGHQGGFLIPKDIANFFPPLPVASSQATVDIRLTADLFVDGKHVATVKTRYQHQTRDKKRKPELRLTDNLGPLRDESKGGDIILFRKDLEDDSYIQIDLIRQGTQDFIKLDNDLKERKWGALNPSNPREIRSRRAKPKSDGIRFQSSCD
jgi:putative restriction endonuclease